MAQKTAELLELLQLQARWIRITPYPSALKLRNPDDRPFVAYELVKGQ